MKFLWGKKPLFLFFNIYSHPPPFKEGEIREALPPLRRRGCKNIKPSFLSIPLVLNYVRRN
jgi:hypothetical protein